jgi:hypothetical protein
MPHAQVAELVDALASGASDRKVVEVRVLSWAPSQGAEAFHRCARVASIVKLLVEGA